MEHQAEYAWLALAIRLRVAGFDQVETDPLGDGPEMNEVYGVAGRFQAAARVAANAQVLELLLALYLVRILGVLWRYNCAKTSAKVRCFNANADIFLIHASEALTLGIIEEIGPFLGRSTRANTITSPHAV